MAKKKFSLLICFFCFFSLSLITDTSYGQITNKITLPAPQKTGGLPLMEALNNRKSLRFFSDKKLSLQTISNLLWAGFGINRPDVSKRTAPSSFNSQEIDLYIALEDGLYKYDPEANNLLPVLSEDIRELALTPSFEPYLSFFQSLKEEFSLPPVVLILVSDSSRSNSYLKGKENEILYAYADASFISQNIYLFAASENLATCVYNHMDAIALAKKMGLKNTQKIIYSHPVGYPLKVK